MTRFGRCVAAAFLVTVSITTWASTSALAGGDEPDFSHPTKTDNKWLPLVPGTQLVYEGRAAQGGQVLPHEIIFIVTGLTKVVSGVRNRVLWDRDFDDGELTEGELTFHAQDDAANVWNFGEYPEIYENGKLTGAPDTWISGIDHARAGIAMLGHPRVGTPSYSQGFAPGIDFADRAKVEKTGQHVCVPAGCFEDVLVTREWSVSEPTAFQFKYYAPGVGNIKVGFSGTDQDQETLVLAKITHLDDRALARVNREALKIDRRGHRISPDVYGRTPRATWSRHLEDG
jgi:hypothetical protein